MPTTLQKSNLSTYCKLALCHKVESTLGEDLSGQAHTIYLFPVKTADWRFKQVLTDKGRATGFLQPTNIWVDRPELFPLSLDHPDPDARLLTHIAALGTGKAPSINDQSNYFIYDFNLADGDTVEMPTTNIQIRDAKIRCAQYRGVFIDSWGFQIDGSGNDAFLKLTGTLRGVGARTIDIVREKVTALDNATDLTLSDDTIYGVNVAAKLKNIHKIMVASENGAEGEKGLATFTAVNDIGTQITIESMGGGGTTNYDYYIYYKGKTQSGTRFDVLDQAVISERHPFKWDQLEQFLINPEYNYTTHSATGGVSVDCELINLQFTHANNCRIIDCRGGSTEQGDKVLIGAADIGISFSRRMIEAVLQDWANNIRTFSLFIKFKGDEIGSTGQYRTFQIFFPKLVFPQAPIAVSDNYLTESIAAIVLEDGTHNAYYARSICDTDDLGT